ncbi:MAG TPA: glycosyltransferase [Thermoanaerobaculia bacterium]|nr:glycosyltransferase [Thermoanaerobaculia bacterium]
MSTIVVETPDVVGERMAGPAIRAWHLAHELAAVAPTSLVAKLEGTQLPAGPVKLIPRGSADAGRAMRNADVLVGQPARGFRKWRRAQHVAFDMFDPTVLELRELYGSAPSLRQRVHLAAEWSRLCYALEMADLLICASPQQKKFYAQLQSSDAPWIEVPFGVDLAETRACEKPKDNVVIWGGGVWAWLDPQTAIEAVHRVNASGVRCKLLFLGRARPNRDLIDRRRDDRFEQLLDASGPDVSANPEWVPYRERLSWLRSGKVAIMLHRPTPEAEYSIRTRLFDAIAAGVPVVATEKGFAADLVAREGLGIVVPPGDVAAVTAALRRLLTDDVFHASCVQSLERLRPRYSWEVVARPLVEAVRRWLKQS